MRSSPCEQIVAVVREQKPGSGAPGISVGRGLALSIFDVAGHISTTYWAVEHIGHTFGAQVVVRVQNVGNLAEGASGSSAAQAAGISEGLAHVGRAVGIEVHWAGQQTATFV